MEIGRCVKNNIGFLGCHNDALTSLDGECAGKSSCAVLVSQSLWKQEDRSCPEALMGYLDVKYSCQKGKIRNEVRVYVRCYIIKTGRITNRLEFGCTGRLPVYVAFYN